MSFTTWGLERPTRLEHLEASLFLLAVVLVLEGVVCGDFLILILIWHSRAAVSRKWKFKSLSCFFLGFN